MRLLVIDTETGGLNHEMFSLLEVGLVAWEDGNIVGSDSFLVYEGESELCVDSDAMEHNRINLDQVRAEGISPATAVQRIRDMTLELHQGDPQAHTRLAGWNLDFDKRFLLRCHKLAAAHPMFALPSYFSHRGFDCPSVMFALAYSGLIDLAPDEINSTSGFEYFKVSPPKDLRHRALGDAVATAKLITAMTERMKQCRSMSPQLNPS